MVQEFLNGAGDKRIATTGKSRQLETLAAAISRLIDSVLNPLEETKKAVQRAIDGDLMASIGLDGKTGYFHDLAMSVNALIANMKAVGQDLQKTSHEVAVGAEEISRENMDLSQRSEEHASSLRETASSLG